MMVEEGEVKQSNEGDQSSPPPNKKLETDSSDSVQVAKPKSVEPELAAEDLETKAQGGGEVEPRKNDEPQASSKSDNESIGDKPKSVEPELPEAEESESESKGDEIEHQKYDEPEPSSKPDGETAGQALARKFSIDSTLLPFPERLMALLDGNLVKDSMWWLPDGDAFCLIPVVFAESVLDKYFQGTKFESFTRKLNRWGFKRVAGQKVPANTIAYYNKDFIKGKPEMLKNMNGGKTKFISAREKRARAQLRREREREKALLVATQQQQQALYADRLGLGGAGLAGVPGGMRGNQALGQSSLPLHSLLTSQQLALQQANDLRVAQQVFAMQQAMAAEQQELQMRLLQGGALQDYNSSLFMQNTFNPAFAGGSLAGLSQLRRGSGDVAATPSNADMTAMMLAGQMPGMPQSDLVGLMMAQQRLGAFVAGATSGFNAGNSSETTKKHLSEEQLKTKIMTGSPSSGSPSRMPAEAGQLDPQLFQLYLRGQQRNGELS